MGKKSKKKEIPDGVYFPCTDSKGKRSTTVIGKRILSIAFAAVDTKAAGALRDEKDNKWRYGYQKHVAKAVNMMASSKAAALAMAKAGLDCVKDTMLFIRDGDESISVGAAMLEGKFTGSFETGTVAGRGTLTNPQSRGDAGFLKQLRGFVESGNMEASCEQSVQSVLEHPEWLDLRGVSFIMLGATSEMGPLSFLLERGATVVAVARSGKDAKKWQPLLDMAASSPGTLIYPTTDGIPGADCLTQAPELANWLSALDLGSRVYIGCYIYLDGESFVRASAAMDAIACAVTARRKARFPSHPLCGLAYIETPSNYHAIPAHCKTISRGYLKNAPIWQKLLLTMGMLKPLKFVSDEKLMPIGGTPAVLMDGLIAVQGPNYALAKLMQRWRIILARSNGQLVSVNVGPATATSSVMHVRTVATALKQCHIFKPQLLFQPDIVKNVLSLLLVRDVQDRKALAQPTTPIGNPLELIADQAWHGGIWTTAYTADSMGNIQFVTGWMKANSAVVLMGLLVLSALVYNFVL
jgi:hypothetical protein